MNAPGGPGLSARLLTPLGATALYAVATLGLTWPLATALTTSLPWDMGDPVLNTWILAWSTDHLWRLVTGDSGAFAGYWHANIFHPAPLTLAYSEHLFAEAVLVLPVWAATDNAILCYNVLFLATFVLSGLGTFLLVRDLTGSARAALVGGLLFAFAPYRIGQYSHVQVLAAQWMPFTLYALRRHFETGSRRSLVGCAAAAVAQNLSCGYYLIYFPPFAMAYGALEITARRRWRDWGLLLRLLAAMAAVALCTWPFVQPYLELRGLGFSPRGIRTIIGFSADVWSYATAHEDQWLWGPRLRAFVKAEGELFPGFAPLVLSAAAVAHLLWTRCRNGSAGVTAAPWRVVAVAVATVVWAASAAAAFVVLATGGLGRYVLGLSLRAATVDDHLVRSAASLAVLLALSAPARAVTARLVRHPAAWFAAFALAAAALSLGPEVRSGGRLVAPDAPYRLLYEQVPGYDGLRVPARYAMIVALSLAVLGGLGVRALERLGRLGAAAALACGLFFLAEAGAAPLPLDRHMPADGFVAPPARLFEPSSPPAVYRYVRTLPADAVLAEFPFGSKAWEVRYMYASIAHGRRLVNGYSGGFPRHYLRAASALRDVTRRPDEAWRWLRAVEATHVIVHEHGFAPGRSAAVLEWLRARGAHQLGRFDRAVVFQLPQPAPATSARLSRPAATE